MQSTSGFEDGKVWGGGLGGGGRDAQSNLDTAGRIPQGGESLQLWGISGAVHGLKAPSTRGLQHNAGPSPAQQRFHQWGE